jgi:hypothetical protein
MEYPPPAGKTGTKEGWEMGVTHRQVLGKFQVVVVGMLHQRQEKLSLPV